MSYRMTWKSLIKVLFRYQLVEIEQGPIRVESNSETEFDGFEMRKIVENLDGRKGN